MPDDVTVQLRPWAPEDRRLLHRLLGDPAMTAYLGGPETLEQIDRRHASYLVAGDGEMFAILDGEGTPVGSIGYWSHEAHGVPAWETGWSVLPEHQGQGLATAAIAACLDRIRVAGDHRPVHAFPRTDNAASNRICEKAGMRLAGELDFEYPKGHPIRCNDWVLDP
jgi:RimJ/RimL family protein N-acetyltransferase